MAQTGKGPTKAQKKNAKRVAKARITADFLRNLPEGVKHCPESKEVWQKKHA